MWYRVWTTVASSVPIFAASIILTVIACVFVIGQHKCPEEDVTRELIITVDDKEFNFEIK